MLVSGFVTYELFSEWKAAQALYLWVPHTAAETMEFGSYEGWIKGIWMLFVVPLVVWLLLGGLVVLLQGAGSKWAMRRGPARGSLGRPGVAGAQ